MAGKHIVAVSPLAHRALNAAQGALKTDSVHPVVQQRNNPTQAVFGADVAVHDTGPAAQHDQRHGVEIEARTEVKWETYTKKIQIEGRVLGDLTMNHIVPIASRYEAMLLDKVYKMSQIGGLDASADIDLLKKIQGHTAAIQTLTIEMIEARKKANRIENAREKAIAYHDTVAVFFDQIRKHTDRLEEIIDDQMWTLPKYRELLFIK